MICFSLERSHRALLRIIHAIVFDAHHAVRNGVHKEKRTETYTGLTSCVQKEGEKTIIRHEGGADKSAKTFQPYQS